jgi:hypothetical protein
VGAAIGAGRGFLLMERQNQPMSDLSNIA